MTYSFLGPDPLEDKLDAVLRRLAEGMAPRDIEVAAVDVKEEPGRRGRDGSLLPGNPENDRAARYLAGEVACAANTAGGGAVVVGVADDGAHTGTALDPEWLRHRIWELTGHRLTVTVREVDLAGTRVLVLTTHEAIEPIRFEGKVRWRVDDHCVEVDPTTWHAGKLHRSGVDWSAQPSGHTFADVNPVAVEIARRYLRLAGDDRAADLARATEKDLLHRLHVLGSDDRLTNAGSLLFVDTPGVGLDYIRRDVPGGDSTVRVSGSGPLLEQVWDVDLASQAANRVVHLPEGFAQGRLRVLPLGAVREAIVNGAVHRDWLSPHPTTIEHIGDSLMVSSPGGFIGGILPTNIITHPAVPRYRSLAGAMSALRLAEREGVGVDRMVRDMLAFGLREPEITEVDGPYVRVGLVGGAPDAEVVALFNEATPDHLAIDVDAVLVIDHASRHGWIDGRAAMPVLQRPEVEAEAALRRVSEAEVDGEPLLTIVHGIPPGHPPAYRLGDVARARLATRTRGLRTPGPRADMVLSWARARGRVSTTEVADLSGLSVVAAGRLLNGLEDEGVLVAGRGQRLGRGFFYTAADG